MEAKLRVGVTTIALALTIVIHLSSLSLVNSSSPQDIQILNAERRIDSTSHIVKVYLTLKIENIGKAPASEVLLAFPPTQLD